MISKHLRHKENEYKNPSHRVVERLKWDHGWDLDRGWDLGWVTGHYRNIKDHSSYSGVRLI